MIVLNKVDLNSIAGISITELIFFNEIIRLIKV